jgi:hypothetical protein
MDWIDLAQNREEWKVFVNTVMNLLIPQNAGKFLSICTTGGLSRRAQIHAVTYLILVVWWKQIDVPNEDIAPETTAAIQCNISVISLKI